MTFQFKVCLFFPQFLLQWLFESRKSWQSNLIILLLKEKVLLWTKLVSMKSSKIWLGICFGSFDTLSISASSSCLYFFPFKQRESTWITLQNAGICREGNFSTSKPVFCNLYFLHLLQANSSSRNHQWKTSWKFVSVARKHPQSFYSLPHLNLRKISEERRHVEFC